MMLDRMQITRFREWINSNDWTLFEYKNKERKNQWNCICSAMDWIDVAIQYIIQHPINSLGEQNSIEELKQNLQKMVFRDLASDHFIESRTVPLKNGWAYWVEKLNDARLGHGYPKTMWISQIEDIFAGKFVFRYNTYQELYVLVKAAIYDISEFKL